MQDGVIRQMEIIEAAARLVETFRQQHPDGDVAGTKGLRNVLMQGYADSDLMAGRLMHPGRLAS